MTVPRTAKLSALVAGILISVVLVALVSVWIVQRDQTLPNTIVAGADVGSLRADELRTALDPIAQERAATPIVFTFDDDEYALRPEDVGYAVDLDATVEAAMSRGRMGLPGDIGERLRSFRTAQEITLVDHYDEVAAASWVADLADELDRTAHTGSVSVDPSTLEIDVQMPSRYVEVDREQLLADLLTGLGGDGPDRFEIVADTAPQVVRDEDILTVAAQVERAIASPFELRSGDSALTLQPREIAQLIEVRETETSDGLTLEMVAVASKVDEVMGQVARGRFETQPEDASYQADRTPPTRFDEPGSTSFSPIPAPVEILEGRDGTRFDAQTAAAQLTILLRDGAHTAELRLETIEPELSNADAERLRPTHLLSTFTTYFTAGEPRSHNIQLLADTIDGTVVMPGEQFSINEISGPRTCDKGYLEAGTIIRGELVQTCGGGTSQFGTTTLNAAFFSGVQLDQWKAHSWYISRYPMGREATLSYPELDVKFTNTTNAALLVKTDHTASSVTVSLYGQPIATTVTATHGEPTNPTTFTTQRRQDSALAPGQEQVLQAGTDGFTVEVARTVERLDGSTDTQTIRTVYVPQTRIIEHGPPARRASSD